MEGNSKVLHLLRVSCQRLGREYSGLWLVGEKQDRQRRKKRIKRYEKIWSETLFSSWAFSVLASCSERLETFCTIVSKPLEERFVQSHAIVAKWLTADSITIRWILAKAHSIIWDVFQHFKDEFSSSSHILKKKKKISIYFALFGVLLLGFLPITNHDHHSSIFNGSFGKMCHLQIHISAVQFGKHLTNCLHQFNSIKKSLHL